MKLLKTLLRFLISPVIMIAAVILFILDNFNFNVSHLASYIIKEVN